ncbi:peptidase C65 Otubain-domain-containing protein [Ochromonadaceae sp. CCMP2298]|nr:peptidase C65 Otubain-domain-containing protein [Ochromonadaceae sp. CCMP2298]
MASNVELDAQRTADEATLRQMGEIERSVKESPMVGDATVVDVLRPDYADTSSPGFLPGIAYLACKYATLRRVRGDGNCFYRSLLFAYLETLVAGLAAALPGSSEELLRVRGVVAASKDTLRDVGYEEFATEDFFDSVLSV